MKKERVEKWGLGCIKVKLADDGQTVEKLYCGVCREAYGEHAGAGIARALKLKGAATSLVEKWILGTDVLKKCNAVDHVTKSLAHQKALLSQQVDGSDKSSRQLTIPENVIMITANQRAQLVRKFQLLHYIVVQCKPFRDYEKFAKFERDIHKVDIGSGYLTAHAARTMCHFIAQDIKQKEITEPLKSGECRYFSLMYDGSSSAKTMEEKEVYLIKTCASGKAVFNVMSLEEPEDCNAPGLKVALNKSVEKLNFTFDRKSRQVGNGSDGAAVNNALFRLEQQELGEHLIMGWCANHKTELGIHDSFKKGELNKASEDIAGNAYYLFKKANLKWRLFKRQAEFLNVKCLKFKRISGTRWVSHQVDSMNSYLRNLPTYLGFLHHQLQSPHNNTMKAAKPILQGHLKASSRLEVLLFMSVKRDILAYLLPFSQLLEAKQLLAPKALSSLKNSIQVITQIKQTLDDNGNAVFQTTGLFPTVADLVTPHLQNTDDNLAIRRTRADGTNAASTDDLQMFHGYPMTTGLAAAFNKVTLEMKDVLGNLEQNLTKRFSNFVDSPIYHSAAIFLDTKKYQYNSVDVLFESVTTIQNHFSSLLVANSCDVDKLRQKFSFIYNHVVAFLSKSKNEQAWQELFTAESALSISNILHIAEICIVIPISSADVERVFSGFSRILSKDRLSLKHESIENELIVKTNDFQNFRPEKYETIVISFLQQHPDGTIRTHKPRPAGYVDHTRKRKHPDSQPDLCRKKNCLFLPESMTDKAPSASAGHSTAIDASPLVLSTDSTESEFTVEDIALCDESNSCSSDLSGEEDM